MLSRGLQSQSYKSLLAQQEEDDLERKRKLEELRRKQLRDEIKRKRAEEDARKKAQLAKQSKEEEAKLAKAASEREQQRKLKQADEELRKQPLSVEEAKARREKAEAKRAAKGLAQSRQELPQKSPAKVLSSKYSDLLAAAPTRLEPASSLPKLPASSGLKSVTHRASNGGLSSRPKSSTTTSLDRPPARMTDKLSTVKPSAPTNTFGKSSHAPASKAPTPASTSRSTPKSVIRNLPLGSSNTLQPLQKSKRDLRTIEEIQNDLHRQKGKDYAYLKSSSTHETKRPLESPNVNLSSGPRKTNARHAPTGVDRRPTVTKEIPVPSKKQKRLRESSSSSGDSFVERGSGARADHGLGESIWDILNPGKKRDQYLARDIDSDEDMEANADDIRREEQRAAKAARLEDEREAKLLAEQEARKASKKKQKLAAK